MPIKECKKKKLFEHYPHIKRFVVDEKATSFTEEDSEGLR